MNLVIVFIYNISVLCLVIESASFSLLFFLSFFFSFFFSLCLKESQVFYKVTFDQTG